MSPSSTQRLFWIREPEPGLWEIDVAREFPRSHRIATVLGFAPDAPADAAFADPATLPEAVRVRYRQWFGETNPADLFPADSTAAHAPLLHLPYLPYHHWRRGREQGFVLAPPADDDPAHALRLAFAATLPGARGAGEVVWGGARFTRDRVARFRRLTTTPGELLLRYAPVSAALQDTLRAGIAAAYFADPTRLADFPATLAVCAYRASRRAPGKIWSRITHDVLGQWHSLPVLRGIGRALRAQLLGCAQRLEAEGDRARGARYRAVDAPHALASLRRNPRRLLALLRIDVTMVERVLTLAHETARPASDQAVFDAAARCVFELGKVLRHVHGADCRRLALPCLEVAFNKLNLERGRRRVRLPQPKGPQALAA